MSVLTLIFLNYEFFTRFRGRNDTKLYRSICNNNNKNIRNTGVGSLSWQDAIACNSDLVLDMLRR
jgi:hypothetical protein